MLRCGQTLVLAGCFSGEGEDNAWILKAGKIPEASSGYQCNAEEADSRIWRHATQTPYTHILIYSPDTDVYNIGLGVIQETSKQYVIQLNVPHAAEKKFLNLNRLESVLYNDPDLASLPRTSIVNIMQTLFICTGCDYVSYFKSIGKSTFFNLFFQYAEFVCGVNMPGCLNETNPDNRESGFLAFIRLVGTAYFKKHLAAFSSLYNHETPLHLFNSIDSSLSDQERHHKWLQTIRSVVADRITSEEERVPSFTSLWRHWLRSCWISQLWQFSNLSDVSSSPRAEWVASK